MSEKTLGQKLREGREKIGAKQKDIADKIFVKRTTLSGYENDRRCPSMNTLQRLAKIYHFEIGYLMPAEEIERNPTVIKYLIKSTLLDISGLSYDKQIAISKYYDYLMEQEMKERCKK